MSSPLSGNGPIDPNQAYLFAKNAAKEQAAKEAAKEGENANRASLEALNSSSIESLSDDLKPAPKSPPAKPADTISKADDSLPHLKNPKDSQGG